MVSDNWSDYPVDGVATAPETGPFPFRPFLKTVWKHRTDRDTQLELHIADDAALALAVGNGEVRLAGQENLTDYHSPIGSDPTAVVSAAIDAHPGSRFRFDSLPGEAADVVANTLSDRGVTFERSVDAIAAVLALPDTADDWLMGIGKKERHEVRRKRRKFEGEFGEIEVVSGGVEHHEEFCRMHRTAPGDKGEFMTGEMAEYFHDLITEAGAVIHLLVCDDRALAAAFGFETEAGYFYYNSALDMSAAHASPGVVLFSSMIFTQIERGAKVFDFLKGDERYKFRHGAEARELFTIEGSIP